MGKRRLSVAQDYEIIEKVSSLRTVAIWIHKDGSVSIRDHKGSRGHYKRTILARGSDFRDAVLNLIDSGS